MRTPEDCVTFAGKYTNTDLSTTALHLISIFKELNKVCGQCGMDCRNGNAGEMGRVAVGDSVEINDGWVLETEDYHDN